MVEQGIKPMNVQELSPEVAGDPLPSRLPTVCIVTFEFVGLYKNGGIGTVSTGLAEMLAAHGHDVTVAFTRPELVSPDEFEQTAALYARKGITLVPLYRGALPELHGSLVGFTCWERFAVYLWLKDRHFDIVHFSEHLGEAYYCLAARRLGLGFRDMEFWIGCHGPSQWVVESNEDIVRDMFWAHADHAERFAIATADVAWAPSRYLLGWMSDNRYAFPARTLFQRYVMPDDLGGIGGRPAPGDAAGAPAPAQELILFGRLETRKGVKLFCQALDRLGDRLAGRKVTFMGRIGVIDNRPSDVYIRERAAAWSFEWRIIDNFGRQEAYRYVTQPGRLAVLASPVDNSPCTVYELLEIGASFVACNAGGIPELIAPASHPDVLFDYNLASLTARLAGALEQGTPLPEPAVSRADNQARLVAAHRRTGPLAQPPAAPAVSPTRLAAVIVYEGDPDALAVTMGALAALPDVIDIAILQSDRRGGLLDAPPPAGAPVTLLNLDAIGHGGAITRLLAGNADGFLVLRAGVWIGPDGAATLGRGLAAPDVAGVVPFSIRRSETSGSPSVGPALSGSLPYGLFEGTAAAGGVLSRAALETLATATPPAPGATALLWFDAAVLAGLTVLPLAESLLDEGRISAAYRRTDERTRLSLYAAAQEPQVRFVFETAFGFQARPPEPAADAPSARTPIIPTTDPLADDATFYRQLAGSRSYRFGRSIVDGLKTLAGRKISSSPAGLSDDPRHDVRTLLLSAAWDLGALLRLPARALSLRRRR